MRRAIVMLFHFGVEQAMSCLFAVFIFLALGALRLVPLGEFPRYDALLILCVMMQALMFATGFESWDEVKVVAVFHVLGLALEIHKVAAGSWSYPGFAYTKVFGVPLFSGFMYAAVAGYMCQAWRRLDLSLHRYPPHRFTVPLSIAIYGNFFTNRWLPDIRWLLIPALFWIFRKTWVRYTVDGDRLQMPLALSFLLIGFFIWLAENIATLFGAWKYPDQETAWTTVHHAKITSWFLLVVVSFLIVARLKHWKRKRASASRFLQAVEP